MIDIIVVSMLFVIVVLCVCVVSMWRKLDEAEKDIVTLVKICQSLKGMIDALHERTKLKD